MSICALESFSRYLAQAYGCAAIAVEDIEGCAPEHADTPARSCWSGVPGTLERLRCKMRQAPAGLLSMPMPARAAPGDPNVLAQMAADAELQVAFVGIGDRTSSSGRLIAVLHPAETPLPERAPDYFRVVAVVPTYNEEDVIAQTLRYLTAQGIEVHLLDNWSTDRTIERARPFLGRGLIAIEKFPPEQPSRTYDLATIMQRVEDISVQCSWAHWVMLHDADERRCGPWSGVGLRDAIWHVDRCGFSCIDHVTLNFWPVDSSFDPDGADLEGHFRYFEFSDHPGHFHQRRAWKRSGRRVSLAASAGHDVSFDGRRVYPYKFLLKHYPIRSRQHGERKVLRERTQRWNAEERARGWHQQYDRMSTAQFVRDARSLRRFDAGFATDFLIERLSGVGIFERPPPWATPPMW